MLQAAKNMKEFTYNMWQDTLDFDPQDAHEQECWASELDYWYTEYVEAVNWFIAEQVGE